MGRIRNFENMRFMPFKKRIGNLAVVNFYMGENDIPKPLQSYTDRVPFSFFEIVQYEPNPYFGKESEYVYDEKNNRYKRGENFLIHPSCFKLKESSFMLAMWENIDHDELTPDLKFVGGRPFHLNKEERKIFFELAQIGQEHLEKILHDFYISQQ
jgi:hypothetical protein